jgi:ABC-2 type transport system permease protein
MVFIGAIVILEAWPVYTIFMAELNHRALSFGQWAGIVLSFSGVAALNATAVIVPMRLGVKSIAEMDF